MNIYKINYDVNVQNFNLRESDSLENVKICTKNEFLCKKMKNKKLLVFLLSTSLLLTGNLQTASAQNLDTLSDYWMINA